MVSRWVVWEDEIGNRWEWKLGVAKIQKYQREGSFECRRLAEYMYRALHVSPTVSILGFVAKAPITQHLAGRGRLQLWPVRSVLHDLLLWLFWIRRGGFFVGWGMAGEAVVRLYSADGIDPRLQQPPSIRIPAASKKAADACEAQDSRICQWEGHNPHGFCKPNPAIFVIGSSIRFTRRPCRGAIPAIEDNSSMPPESRVRQNHPLSARRDENDPEAAVNEGKAVRSHDSTPPQSQWHSQEALSRRRPLFDLHLSRRSTMGAGRGRDGVQECGVRKGSALSAMPQLKDVPWSMKQWAG
jgi:hypothetical protein